MCSLESKTKKTGGMRLLRDFTEEQNATF
jgi:hypothetical protein